MILFDRITDNLGWEFGHFKNDSWMNHNICFLISFWAHSTENNKPSDNGETFNYVADGKFQNHHLVEGFM